jgi:pre-mRNA-splicing helicase BRR2
LTRDAEDEDDEDDSNAVIAPFYPSKKMTHWWLIVGEPSTRQLLSIKRVTLKRTVTVNLEFTLPQGSHALKLYLICDSYMGADHDIQLDPIEVGEGDESDSDDDMSNDDGSS